MQQELSGECERVATFRLLVLHGQIHEQQAHRTEGSCLWSDQTREQTEAVLTDTSDRCDTRLLCLKKEIAETKTGHSRAHLCGDVHETG